MRMKLKENTYFCPSSIVLPESPGTQASSHSSGKRSEITQGYEFIYVCLNINKIIRRYYLTIYLIL